MHPAVTVLAAPGPPLSPLSPEAVADALDRVEAGLARDVLEDKLKGDLSAIGADGIADLGRYRSVPVEALPYFAGIARRRGIATGAFLGDLDALFARVGRNRANVRDLRSLLVLAEAGGGDTPALVRQFLASPLSAYQKAHLVRVILAESPQGLSADSIAEDIELLSRHQNPAQVISRRMANALLQRFDLAQLRKDRAGRITDKGMREFSGQLLRFFSKGLAATRANDKRTGQPTFDEKALEAVLLAVLEDRYDGFRFTTAKADHQLKSLNAAQRAMFVEGQEMLHVRFSGDGERVFRERVANAARIGGELLACLQADWGAIDAVRAEHARLVAALRGIDKEDRASRKPLVTRIRPLSERKAAMEHAEWLAKLRPGAIGPTAFAQSCRNRDALAVPSSPEAGALLQALDQVLRIDDLSFGEAQSTDRPDLSTIEAVLADCVKWPSTDAMGYLTDANLRFIVTHAADGRVCRAIMRLVERQDEGHVGAPMLILERAYPDAQGKDEKRRLMEHLVRRACAMKIPAAFPVEYYWDASSTRRGARKGIADMNDAIDELGRSYGSGVERRTLTVTNPAGSSPSIYIDSAPYELSHIGRIPSRKTGVKARRYDGRVDNTYTNIFMMLAAPGSA